MMCKPAMKEFCRAIIEAKLFLQDCSLQADFYKSVNSICKLDTGEVYDVLLHDLAWSKAGLDLAILYADDNSPSLQSIEDRVLECTSLLLDYTTTATQSRLNGDRDELYRCVQNRQGQHLQLYSSETQKKCLTFLLQKSKAHQELSHAAYRSRAQPLNVFEIDSADLLADVKQRYLGSGSYGEVYRSTWLGQPVAVKVFSISRQELFKNEATLLAGIRNPFIIHMVGWCKKNGDCMLVMELAQTDLQKVIDSTQALSVHAAVDIMLQISKGMEYLHERGVIHRDVKPSNILLEPCSVKEMAMEGHARVKLCDFGFAKVKQLSAKDRSRYSTLKLGTSYYRAPELLVDDEDAAPKYTRKADVFSFAITCSEILAGRSATSCFESLNSKVLRAKMLENVRPSMPTDCPSHLEELIKRSWDTDPERRPPFSRISSTLTYIKFILMRVSDVQRVRLYDSVVSPFDEDELEKRISEDGELMEVSAKRTNYHRSAGVQISEEEDEYLHGDEIEPSNILDTKVEEMGTSAQTCIMQSGDSLQTHQFIMCNGYKFVMQECGILVLYTPPEGTARECHTLWATHTYRRDESCCCVLEEDGNLVIYDSRGRHPDHVVWSSNSGGKRATRSSATGRQSSSYKLELDENGRRAVIRDPQGSLIWATDESVDRTRMKSGQFLAPHQWMLSEGCRLIMQGDGNLVLYDTNNSNRALWASHTSCGGAVCICKLQEDGNLVIYDTRCMPARVVWSSRSARGRSGAGYSLELDGRRAVIRAPQGLIWATDGRTRET